MSTPAARSHPIRFANFQGAPEDLRDICDIWLDSVCSASWSTKEAQRVAAFLATCIHSNRTSELFLRDVESALNIQTEESQRALKLLKLFGAVDDVQIERGKITVDARVSTMQRLRLARARAELANLATADTQRAMNAGIAALRAASAQAAQYKFDDAELDRALG